MIDELKRENKTKNKKILQLEIRVNKIENEKKENIQTIGDKAQSNNNVENTKNINKNNRDEIIDWTLTYFDVVFAVDVEWQKSKICMNADL